MCYFLMCITGKSFYFISSSSIRGFPIILLSIGHQTTFYSVICYLFLWCVLPTSILPFNHFYNIFYLRFSLLPCWPFFYLFVLSQAFIFPLIFVYSWLFSSDFIHFHNSLPCVIAGIKHSLYTWIFSILANCFSLYHTFC